jgi:acylpyruvate hydrolase
MRYVTYQTAAGTLVGVHHGQDVLEIGPLPAAFDEFYRMVQGFDPAKAPRAAASRVPAMPRFTDARVICLGLNYVEHAKEGGREPPDYPAFFFRVDTSLAADGATVPMPRVSTAMDYEAELLVVVGKGGRYIPEDRALDHVFGYGVFNDISLRDYQRKGGQWTPGKNFDGTGIVGSEIVTPDELPPGAAGLGIRAILNGQVMQDANTDMMIFSVARAISLISDFMTLKPGDLIAMGTPSGVGFARTPPVWMAPGDTITIEIDRVGRISSPIGENGHA